MHRSSAYCIVQPHLRSLVHWQRRPSRMINFRHSLGNMSECTIFKRKSDTFSNQIPTHIDSWKALRHRQANPVQSVVLSRRLQDKGRANNAKQSARRHDRRPCHITGRANVSRHTVVVLPLRPPLLVMAYPCGEHCIFSLVLGCTPNAMRKGGALVALDMDRLYCPTTLPRTMKACNVPHNEMTSLIRRALWPANGHSLGPSHAPSLPNVCLRPSSASTPQSQVDLVKHVYSISSIQPSFHVIKHDTNTILTTLTSSVSHMARLPHSLPPIRRVPTAALGGICH